MLRSIVIWYLSTCSSATCVFDQCCLNEITSDLKQRYFIEGKQYEQLTNPRGCPSVHPHHGARDAAVLFMPCLRPRHIYAPLPPHPGISMPRASISMPAAPPWLNGISSICSRGYEMCPIAEETWRIGCHEGCPIQGANPHQTFKHWTVNLL